MNDPLDADGVSKNTTPNALREASADRLDHIYNCAVGNLRNNNEKNVRQMEESIRAIRHELQRRDKINSDKQWKAMMIVAVVSALAAWAAVLLSILRGGS